MDINVRDIIEDSNTPIVGTSENEENERWRLTPKGIFVLALINNNIADINDPRVEDAYRDFAEMMKRHGYVTEEGDEPE